MMAELAAGRDATHPVLDTPGWWRRPDRFGYRRVGPAPNGDAPLAGRPILVTGAAGTTGKAFVRACRARGLACVALEDEDAASVAAARERHRPWAVVNAAELPAPTDVHAALDRLIDEAGRPPG
jgi:dTDP-4-dehydrorhamnose reductase